MKTECPVCFNIGRHGDGCPVAQRELDAMKRGAEKAAEIAGASGAIQSAKATKQAILTASSQWTTEDLK